MLTPATCWYFKFASLGQNVKNVGNESESQRREDESSGLDANRS
jgi:hypothetical protein